MRFWPLVFLLLAFCLAGLFAVHLLLSAPSAVRDQCQHQDELGRSFCREVGL